MIKLLMLFLSLGSNLYHQDFIVKEEETREINESIEYQGYVLKQTENSQVLSINDYEIMTFSNKAQVKWCYSNYKLKVITLENGKVKLYEMDKYGQVLVEKVYLSTFSNIDIISFKDNIYLVGGVSDYSDGDIIGSDYHHQIDAVILMLDSKYNIKKAVRYGGVLNDYFIDVKSDNNCIYLCGVKETLSGGDFGNGGSEKYGYLIAKVDENLQLLNYGVFKDEIIDFEIYDDNVYVITTQEIYLLSDDLKYQNSLKFASVCKFCMFSANNTLLTINSSGINIYDLVYLKNIFQVQKEDIVNVYLGKDTFYLETKSNIIKMKIFDIRFFKGEEGKVYNFFREIPLTKKEITPTYNPMVWGTYQARYYFDDLEINQEIIVPQEINITDGLIYPLGYRLKFTGIAYLNGEMVNNNHALMKTGKQELTIYNCHGEGITYNFTVVNNQISFDEESIKNYHLEVYPHEEFTFKIKVKTSENININKVIVNNEEYPFTLEDDYLIINVQALDSGLYHYQLEKIIYEVNEKLYCYDVNYTYDVKVLNPLLNLSTTLTNDKNYLLYNSHVDDPFKEIRGFKLYLHANGEELQYCYAIKDTDLVLRGLNSSDIYETTLMVQYAPNNKDVKEVTLAHFNLTGVSDSRIGYIDIIQSGEGLDSFQVGISQKYLSEVYHLDQPIYIKEDNDLFVPLFCGGVVGLILGISIIYYRIHKKRKPF